MTEKQIKTRVQNVGKQLHEAREAAGLSQRELASRCDLTHADISRIETGKANPTLRMLLRVMDALAVSRLII